MAMTPLEWAQRVKEIQQANEVILIHLGVKFRHPTNTSIDAQIRDAIEQHRGAIAEVWTPEPKVKSVRVWKDEA
jgi:hypothetical protein